MSDNHGRTVSAPRSAVLESRLRRLARGVNITRWFALEMQQSAGYFTNYLRDDDLQLIHDLGFGFVRLAIAPEYLYRPEMSMNLDLKMLGYIDAAIDRCLMYDLGIIIEIHALDTKRFEQDTKYVDGFVTFWKALAEHFNARDPEMIFLELLNEPVFETNPGLWSAIQQQLVTAIRAKAPQHTLIVTGASRGGIDGLFNVQPVGDPNVLYSFHFYEPIAFTHQGADWMGEPFPSLRDLPYPSSPAACADVLPAITDSMAHQWAVEYCKTAPWDADKIARRIAQVAAWAKSNGVKLLVGEFGVYCPAAPSDARLRWLQDARIAFEKNGIGWTLWGYDDCFGLGRTLRDGTITIDQKAASVLGLDNLR